MTCTRPSARAADSLRNRWSLASRFTALAGALVASFVAACGGSGSGGQIQDQGPGQIGQPATKDDGELYDGNLYLVDPHSGGKSNEFLLVGAAWGRLVDVFDFDSTTGDTRLVYPEFVVGQDVRTEPGKWTLETNPASGVSRLTLLVKKTEVQGDPFDLLVQEARNNLSPVAPKSLQPGELPPFPLIARNSVLEVQFNDLIAENSIEVHETVRILTGNPPTVPFDVRVVPSSNHGGVIQGAFHSTRLLLDLTISEFESQSAPGLVLNGLGLPASLTVTQPNVVLRFPTQVNPSVGQFKVLRNLKGEALATNGNGPVATNLPTLDVERALRSGAPSDANNGFLLDLEAPRLVSQQAVTVTSATPDPDPSAIPGYDFIVSFGFDTPVCAFNPIVGDALIFGSNLTVEASQPGSAGAGGTVAGLRVRAPLIGEPLEAVQLVGAATYLTPYRTQLSGQAGCFLNFTPGAKEPPLGSVPPNAAVTVRFSEPMDPVRVRPFDSFRVVRLPTGSALTFRDYVVGEILAAAGQREFRFQPSLSFEHSQNNQAYHVDLLTGPSLLTDLAGNPLAAVPPQVTFRIDPTAPSVISKGYVLRFANANLQEAGTNGTDLRGQFLYDQTGFIRPRIPVRFPAIADRNQLMIGKMQPIPLGVITPLSALGSKLQQIWRYPDFGFSISETDDALMNLDIEGVALAPLSGQVITALFPQFEIRLAHSNFLPDELIDPQTVLPVYPNSGLKTQWAANLLVDPVGNQKIVHPRSKGFAVSPAEVFQSTSGVPMLRTPINVDATSDAEKQFYTWRDTAVLAKGGVFQGNYIASTPGVPFDEEKLVFGLTADPMFSSDLPPGGDSGGGLPSVGLPLLVEYRCFPTETVSLNVFDISIASTSTALGPLQGRPVFRAFATGGVDTAGQVQTVNPDLVPNADVGGYNGNPALGPIGMSLPGTDPVVYIGQADVVLRISRAYTRVIDAVSASLKYKAVVVEPKAEQQPAGTSIVLAWRGHSATPGGLNADLLDVYGDVLTQSSAGTLATKPWMNLAQLQTQTNLRFLQTRMTFISNTATQLSPILDSYGLAFSD